LFPVTGTRRAAVDKLPKGGGCGETHQDRTGIRALIPLSSFHRIPRHSPGNKRRNHNLHIKDPGTIRHERSSPGHTHFGATRKCDPLARSLHRHGTGTEQSNGTRVIRGTRTRHPHTSPTHAHTHTHTHTHKHAHTHTHTHTLLQRD